MADVEKVITNLELVKASIEWDSPLELGSRDCNIIAGLLKELDELQEQNASFQRTINALIGQIQEMEVQIPKWHLVADNDFPTELEIVNVVWCNHNPPSYYQNIRDKRFVASAVYFKGKWYWYSSTCIDYLKEYGKNDFDLIDKDIEVIAWMELPKISEVE